MKDRDKLKERIADVVRDHRGRDKGFSSEEIAERILQVFEEEKE
jgi:hypothetical protein